MNKSNPPTSFGVFKPVGHVVIALGTDAQTQALASELTVQGFSADDLVHYTPQEMIDQVAAQILTASPLASVGQDLNLIKAHRALAEDGCSFLVVHAPNGELVAKVAAAAKNHHAKSAQRYGSLIVEELIISGDGESQTFESPDTGLDSPDARQVQR
jgi:hypothetical protein